VGLSLEGPVTVDLQTGLAFEFSFGIDLTDGAVDSDDFFFQSAAGLVLDASVNQSAIQSLLGFGLVDLTAQDGTADLEADYNVTWNNPDADPLERITFQELQNTPTDDLLTVQATGQGQVVLPVEADFLPFAVGGNPTITASSSDLFDTSSETLQFNADFDPIQQFNEDLKQAVLDGLVAQVDLTDQIEASDPLGQSLFLINGSIGEFLDIGSVLDSHIVQPAADFLAGDDATLAGLIDVLNAQNGVFDDLTFNLNATGQLVGDELLINLTINAQRTTPDLELRLGDDIEDILIAETLTADLVTTLDWQLAVGVNLDALPSTVDAVFARYATPIAVAADLALPDIVVDAQAGFLGLSLGNIVGQASTLSLDVDITVAVHNPDADADGNVTLAELQSTPFDTLVTQAGTAQVDINLLGLSGVDGVATLRELNGALGAPDTLIASKEQGGSVSLDLPLGLSSSFAGVVGETQVVFHADVNDINDPDTLRFTFLPAPGNPVLGLLNAVEQLTVNDVVAAIEDAGDYLTQLESQGLLADPLPGLNQSIGQLLGFGDTYEDLVQSLVTNPPQTLQGVEAALNGLDGVTGVTLTLDDTPGTESLRIDLTVDLPDLDTQVPLTLDLTTLGVDLVALGLDPVSVVMDSAQTSPLNVTADGTLNLALGVDLSDETNPRSILFDTTSVILDLTATPPDLDFGALFGAMAVEISNGSYTLDVDGEGGANAPAQYRTELAPGVNGQHLTDNAAAATTVQLDGALDVDLPILFPSPIAAGQPDLPQNAALPTYRMDLNIDWHLRWPMSGGLRDSYVTPL